MSQHPFYTEADAARRGSLPYPGANHEVPENSPFATAGSTHPEQVSSPITTFSHQQQQSFQDPYHNAPPSALSVADSRNWPLQRNPTQSTVSPFDSASNWGGDDDLSHKGRFTQSQHLGQYGQSNYLQQDPYGRASQASLAPHTNAGPNPYEEHDEYDHHHDSSRLPLVENAAYADTSRGGAGGYAQPYDTSEQQYPPTSVIEKNRANRESHASGSEGQNILGELEKARAQRPPIWQRLLRDTTPLEDRVYYKQQGIGVQSRPWLCWVLSGGMIIAMIVVLARQWKLTDSPIATKPQFNPMIGPSSEVLIQEGARFVPCMKLVPELIDEPFACPNNTKSQPTETCTLEEICGFGGFDNKDPDQNFRFILPIFLHAGIVHLILNLLVQCLSSGVIEREMGSLRFFFLYFAAGIFGFILSSNFALIGQPSVGASGAIFGTHGAILVDLLAHFKLVPAPKRKLLFLIIEIVVGIGIGFIPFVDNFAHIGGFAMGLLCAIVLYPTIHQTARHKYIFYGLRVLALVGILLFFVLLTRNFYTSDPNSACTWCRYLSCWPTDSNNHCKGTGLQEKETSTSLTPAIALLVGQYMRRRLG